MHDFARIPQSAHGGSRVALMLPYTSASGCWRSPESKQFLSRHSTRDAVGQEERDSGGTEKAGMNHESSVYRVGLTNTTIKQRKGLTIMHDIELVVIWLFSVSMGIILTIVMTGLATQSRRHMVSQDMYEGIRAFQLVHRQEGELVPITSRAPTTACVISDREATGPPRAA